MCGIIGYTGNENALPILLSGLYALEYRGYDSAGVAFFPEDSTTDICTFKTKGRIAFLEKKLNRQLSCTAFCGIGHTRWATHGEPSDLNAHPHATKNLALVHNGIIENYADIEKRLTLSGYTFESQTDTEGAAKLIDFYYSLSKDPLRSIFSACADIRGSYAFAVMFNDFKGKIFVVRKDSPLIVASSESGSLIASDVTAILKYTNKYVRLPENTVACIDTNGAQFFAKDGQKVEIKEESVSWTVSESQKSSFPHFMLKEIFEESDTLKKTVSARIKDSLPHFPELDFVPERIHIVACGTAMHAGLIGKSMIESQARIPLSVEIASEFRYRDPILDKNDLVIVLSQSGETADTLAALRHAKSQGIRTLAIVNVVGSSIARESDRTVYTLAGPEIAVASTKAYTLQASLLCLISVKLALDSSRISEESARSYCRDMLEKVPASINAVLEKSELIRELAKKYTDHEHMFYIGRGIDSDLCAEGSLKLKEISYIHSEAYAAGELKHGTISLITDGIPVVALITDIALAEKTVSGIREVRSRKAKVLAIVSSDVAERIELPCDDIIKVPQLENKLTVFPAATVLQLFAYHAAALRGLDVDKPRNLAKSVTVE